MTTNSSWREFVALLSANALSMIGNTLTAIAIPWFVYELTGSATMAAGVVLAGQLPSILAGFFGGYFIDRLSAKQVSLFSDTVNFFAVLSIPLLFSVDLLDLMLLSGLVFFTQVLDSPGSIARQVLVTELIDRHRLPRERAIGLDSLVENAADLLGPVLGGFLLTLVGALTLLVIDAVTFLFSFAIIAIGIRAKVKTKHEVATQPIWQVWKWIFKQRQILKLGLYDTIINAVATPLLALTLPLLAKEMGDTGLWLGVWLACFAAGTMLTTTIYAFFGHRLSPLTLLKLTPLGQAIGLFIVFWIVYSDGPLILISAGLFLYGTNLGVGSMVDAFVLQEQVPEDRRGNVFAAFSSLRFMGVPFGLLIAGTVTDQINVETLFLIFCLLLLIPSLLWITEKELDTRIVERH